MSSSAGARIWYGAGAAAALTAAGYWGVSACGGLEALKRRNHLLDVDGATPVKVEECRRYPCRALQGYDVVVRNYFYAVPEEREAPWSHVATAVRHMFGNGADRRPPPPPSCLEEARFVPEADKDGEQRLTVSPCCSSWPRGTQKFSALVLEPTTRASSRNLIEQWSDGATDQSVVRCHPLCRRAGQNCQNTGESLEAPYLRSMLSALALLPPRIPPLHVGMLGVGGGSLPAFLQRYCGQMIARMDLVDVEPMCFQAALNDLGLGDVLEIASAGSPASGGAHLFAMDAVRFLQEWATGFVSTPEASDLGALSGDLRGCVNVTAAQCISQRRPFDLLLVDLYTGSAPSPALEQRHFLELCRASLSPHGVAVFNLPQRLLPFERECAQVFGSGEQVYSVPVPFKSNCVVVVCREKSLAVSNRVLYHRAAEVSKRFQLPFSLEAQLPFTWRFW